MENPQVLAQLRELAAQRPTYGYRRLWALLRRIRHKAGLAPVNAKRVYRLAKAERLLLPRHTGAPPVREHEGTLAVTRSDQRYGSNGFEIACDNGSGYIARETRAFATDIGLLPRRTPYRSPQSNGMAEAVVKTIKRDYVAVNPTPDARTVLEQLPKGFADDNPVHPHSALKYRSPEEFRQAQQSP